MASKRMGDAACWVRTFEVTEPTRHRKGFTVYKVTSVVFPKAFPESATKITVWKRYSDFRKLHKDLELIFKQLYLKGEFPVFPKAKVFGRFEHEVVEERRKAAWTLLEFTANYLQLFTSKPFMQFFDSGYNTQDFIGKILFKKVDDNSINDPPTTVLQEKSELNAPCLEPHVLWNENGCHVYEGDTASLSPSSSSISPTESAEMPVVPVQSNDDKEPVASSSSASVPESLVTKPTNGEKSTSSVVTAENGSTSKKKILSLGESFSSLSSNQYINCKSQPHSSHESETSSIGSNHRPNGIVRSATVTDELSSYYDEEFEDAAFLFPAGSCSSLDTLPGFTPSSDVVDSAQKDVPSSSRGLFTLSRKKSNGFGFFDFLPLFPKKSKKKSSSKEAEKKEQEEVKPVVKTSLSVGYICEAAGHFAVAQFHESNTDYGNAFSAYKEGIRVLLAGAQDDTDRDRKLLAKNKLEKYLTRAESLKESFLSPGTSTPVFSSPSKKVKSLSALTRQGRSDSLQSGKTLLSSIEELKPYKVVGLGSKGSRILIVMNPEESSPKCYATKVLWKSSCIIYPEKPTVIPCHIPFMVKLLKWFDTPDKIILLLEHAGGGRLEHFVRNYQSKRLSLSTPPEEVTPIEEKKIDPICEQSFEPTHSNDTDLTSNQGCGIEDTVNGSSDHNNSEQDLHTETSSTLVKESELLSENEVFATPTVSPPVVEEETSSDPNNIDVNKLLENSKALLQTVSKTLEIESSPKKTKVVNKDNEVGNNSNPLQTEEDKVDCSASAKPNNEETVTKNSSQLVEHPSRKNSEADDFLENYIPVRMVPEGVVKVWAAEIVIALESLHDFGITYGDLQLSDILLGENGHILLRYKSLWTETDDRVEWNFYAAPEIRDSIGTPLWKVHPSADWWSLGAILFVLLTGQTLHEAHPEGIYPEMIVKVPEETVCETPVSKCAQTLLKELLQYSPEIRLGYYGAAEIKTHPFFDGYDWERALDEGKTEDENIFLRTTT